MEKCDPNLLGNVKIMSTQSFKPPRREAQPAGDGMFSVATGHRRAAPLYFLCVVIAQLLQES